MDWMDQVPYLGPTKVFHLRTVSLLYILWGMDTALLLYALDTIATFGIVPGIGPIILFASEYAILLASCMNAWLKCSIACRRRARRRGGQNAPVWEDKSTFLFYAEFHETDYLPGFLRRGQGSYGLPLKVIRVVYVTARSFLSRVQGLVRYRKATKNVDRRYPNATQAELDATSDKTCIICREDMVLPGVSAAQGGERAAMTTPQPASEPKPADGPNEHRRDAVWSEIPLPLLAVLVGTSTKLSHLPSVRPRKSSSGYYHPCAWRPTKSSRWRPTTTKPQPGQDGQRDDNGAQPPRPANTRRLLERLSMPLAGQSRNAPNSSRQGLSGIQR